MTEKRNQIIVETDLFSNEDAITNTKVKDSANKLVFGDSIMCAQFLRGYSNIELLKNVQPEDIEDITERFIPLLQESKDSDTVKKVHLAGQNICLYLIAIIEHQSKIHYDMAFRMLQYIVYVLEDYRKEQEKLHPGITKTKDFRYPPILPVVYYEGSEQWTASRNFKDRVELSDALDAYIPDFEYLLVPLNAYSNQEIMAKGDELSLIMLINKLRSAADFKKLKNIPPEYFKNLEERTPDYLLSLITKIISVLLYRLNVPDDEVDAFTNRILRREFDMMFDSFEAYDVQETRRVSREEGKAEGYLLRLVELIIKKFQKNYTIQEIADILEEDEKRVQDVCEIIEKYAPDYDAQKICEEYLGKD